MSISGHFSATTAGALVVGGIAAFVLATLVASNTAHRERNRSAPAPATEASAPTSAAPGLSASSPSAPGDQDVEYPLDTGEATAH